MKEIRDMWKLASGKLKFEIDENSTTASTLTDKSLKDLKNSKSLKSGEREEEPLASSGVSTTCGHDELSRTR